MVKTLIIASGTPNKNTIKGILLNAILKLSIFTSGNSLKCKNIVSYPTKNNPNRIINPANKNFCIKFISIILCSLRERKPFIKPIIPHIENKQTCLFMESFLVYKIFMALSILAIVVPFLKVICILYI